MKTLAISTLTAGLMLLAFAVNPARAAVTFNDDVDITGSNTTFGTWSTGGVAGVSLNYCGDGPVATITFMGSGSSTQWQWWNYNGTPNAAPAMMLDPGNQLILYTSGTNGTIGITLNPYASGTSAFAGNITTSGSGNTMPNQTLAGGSGSILPKALGDGLYTPLTATSNFVSSSDLVVTTATGPYGETGPAFSLQGSGATGPYSFAGAGCDASGDYSVALGHFTTSSGYSSTAVGMGYATNELFPGGRKFIHCIRTGIHGFRGIHHGGWRGLIEHGQLDRCMGRLFLRPGHRKRGLRQQFICHGKLHGCAKPCTGIHRAVDRPELGGR